MDPLTFDQSSPKCFILAADAQYTSVSPENDQVWELDLDQTNIYPFNLHTTYGLRASSMRVFPNLLQNKRSLLTNADTTDKPQVTQYSPAFLRILSTFHNDTFFQFDVFAIESNSLVGDALIKNDSNTPVELIFQLAALLTPLGMGTSSHPINESNKNYISGHSNGLWPVLFMTGGPSAVSNPYPALSLPIQVAAHRSLRISWALVTDRSQPDSLDKAQNILESDWREKAQYQRMAYEENTIYIHTGNSDWDRTFFLAQTCAMTHLSRSGANEQTLQILRSRLPDDPPARDSKVQNGLTTLETYHLLKVLIPNQPKIIADQLDTYLSQLNADGSLESKLQVSPFVKPYKEPPLLAKLCLEYYETQNDKSFLTNFFPDLQRNFESWLERPDEEILAAWQSPQQLQLEAGIFIFDRWEEWGRGIDIRTVQSPALIAMLLSESKALMAIAKILADEPQYQYFMALSAKLTKKIQSFWNDSKGEFCYQDIGTSLTPAPEFKYSSVYQNNIVFNKRFVDPQRLLIHLYANDQKTRACKVEIHGEDPNGRPVEETFSGREILWVLGKAHLVSSNRYQTLHSISIQGLSPDDRIAVENMDLQQTDITCLLPIWSGGIEKEQIERLLDTTINPEDPALTAGIPETWSSQSDLPESLPIYINVMWNTLIIEGLNRQGFINEARDLFTNMMEWMVSGLKHHGGFFPLYERDKNLPSGGKNALAGLPPLDLFFRIAGIKLFSPNRVATWGRNSFPWPVEVHWQGLSLSRQGIHTRIMFPSGALYESDSEEPQIITPAGNKV